MNPRMPAAAESGSVRHGAEGSEITVHCSSDAQSVLRAAEAFLATQPVLHNLILTSLHDRIREPGPGRYWLATDGAGVRGVAAHSPTDSWLSITPMSSEVVTSTVLAISNENLGVAGVSGEAASAAAFAGQWTEARRCGARPVTGMRIYTLADPPPPPDGVRGYLRQADESDRKLLIDWMSAFQAAIGEPTDHAKEIVAGRLPQGHFWLWDDQGPVCLASDAIAVLGITRIRTLFTPLDRRLQRYASATVSALSRRNESRGDRTMLYADTVDPLANSVYRRSGFRVVAEALRYEFLETGLTMPA